MRSGFKQGVVLFSFIIESEYYLFNSKNINQQWKGLRFSLISCKDSDF